jgi:hypothetical protein
MSDEPAPTYGKKRVYAQALFWIDPAILHGIDTIAERRSISRAKVVRDALYTAVYAVLRDGIELRDALVVPHSELYEAIPNLRLHGGTLVEIDEFGLEIPEGDPRSALHKAAKRDYKGS